MAYHYLTSPTLARVPDLLDFVSARTGEPSPGTSHRLATYFVHNNGDDAFLRHTNVVARAQSGLSSRLVREADYLTASVRIPIFSAAFVAAIGSELERDLEFHRCVVRCRDEEFDDYSVARVRTVLPLIDEARSRQRPSAGGGAPILAEPFFREEYANQFLIARDARYRTMVCSPRLVELVQAHRLKVRFTATS
ncbi:hypothetical protein BDK92_3229 [Micromonospora pisi]|uniref:Uncharacterized protein n=1 Tax=Micromonospora pisi TaxID=589240 RepID=A0A495JJY9_9ACTN|nr:hypothetical protein [Micromonospora pisi]RKR88898.1 hypothetical protein BDK92_3229 [Micromonospora pisi]